MFDYDVSTLKDFTFSSIYDVFALIAQNYPVRSRYDIESFEYKSDYLAEGKSYKIVPKSFFEKYQKEYEDEKEKFFKDYYGTQGASAIYSPCDILTIKYNKLLNNRKEIIETKGITSRKYMDKEISNHKFDLMKRNVALFTGSYSLWPISVEADIKFMEMIPYMTKTYELEEFVHGPQNEFNNNELFFVASKKGFEDNKTEAISKFLKNELDVVIWW